MKCFLPFAAACLVLAACSSLPQVRPAGDFTARIQQTCREVFPKGKWQFVHSIEAVMPGGRGMFVTGVAAVSSEERSFQCVIMTLEGFTVFDAEWDGQLTVNRAVPPFDSRPFAEGLAEDIRLLFFHPPGSPVESGFLENGASLCRYRNPDQGVVDVVRKGNGRSEIRRYAPDLHLVRSVSLVPGRSSGQPGISGKIELTAHGDHGYKLIMNLVEAVALE